LSQNGYSGFGSQFFTPSISSSVFAKSDPLECLLFRYLKEVLQENLFAEPDELLSAIQEILRGVNRETLDAVFQECMIRLQKELMEMVNISSDV
jgi:hypothetical protein